MAEPAPTAPQPEQEQAPALQNGTPAQTTTPTQAPPEMPPQTDVEMVDSSLQAARTPTHNPPTQAPTPTTAAVPTSTRNSPHPSAPQTAPVHANPHGCGTRQYLNQHVTPHLLEAMKHLATHEPDKPLKWLSEFLAQKSLEVEGQ